MLSNQSCRLLKTGFSCARSPTQTVFISSGSTTNPHRMIDCRFKSLSVENSPSVNETKYDSGLGKSTRKGTRRHCCLSGLSRSKVQAQWRFHLKMTESMPCKSFDRFKTPFDMIGTFLAVSAYLTQRVAETTIMSHAKHLCCIYRLFPHGYLHVRRHTLIAYCLLLVTCHRAVVRWRYRVIIPGRWSACMPYLVGRSMVVFTIFFFFFLITILGYSMSFHQAGF